MNMKKIFFIGVLALVVLSSFASSAWWDSNWSYRKEITLDSTVGADLTGFPSKVLVDTESIIADGKMDSDCGDIRFTWLDKSSGIENPVDYEIEKNTCNTKTTIVYVYTPVLYGGAYTYSTVIYMYYRNNEAKDAQYPKNVWSNGYSAVYHLSNQKDSLWEYDFTENNGAITTVGMNGVNNTAYLLGPGKYVRRDGAIGNIGASDMSIFAILKPDLPAPGVYSSIRYFIKKTGVNVLISISNEATAEFGQGIKAGVAYERNGIEGSYQGIEWKPNTWTTYGFTNRYGKGFTGFINSTKIGVFEYSGTGKSAGIDNLWTGYDKIDYGFQGIADEIRISNVSRTDDWMKAEYSQTFKLGAEEILPTTTIKSATTEDTKTANLPYQPNESSFSFSEVLTLLFLVIAGIVVISLILTRKRK
jgi:biopolymer transport protein ExbB